MRDVETMSIIRVSRKRIDLAIREKGANAEGGHCTF